MKMRDKLELRPLPECQCEAALSQVEHLPRNLRRSAPVTLGLGLKQAKQITYLAIQIVITI